MKKILLCSFFCLFAVVGCRLDHESRCEMDCEIYIGYCGKNGEDILDCPGGYRIWTTNGDLYEQPSNIWLKPHWHKSASSYVSNHIVGYFAPEICDKTFPRVRFILETYLENFDTGDAKYYISDTIDVELEYFAVDKCMLKSYSLNGVPVWRRDTCQTDYSRKIRLCEIVIDPDRFIERVEQ